MNILVIGSGGREHALCHSISKSSRCKKLLCVPGNIGISSYARCIEKDILDIEGLVALALKENIELVIVGPEAPLVYGLTDRLVAEGIDVFGPSERAAQIEGSKIFMKDICLKYGVPSAGHKAFKNPLEAKKYVNSNKMPIVIKADGLAAGKGVIICNNSSEAYAAIDQIMVEKKFGESGSEIIVEEFLSGEEVSFFALVCGENAVPLISVQDHKKAFDGDKGPNTGGMGAYSPTSIVNESMTETIMGDIIYPTIKGMVAEKIPYRGVLFAGLMITKNGPKLIEYNCRFGDPECQILMARLKSDSVEMFLATAQGRLKGLELVWNEESAITVVMANRGYPGHYVPGSEITGLKEAVNIPGVNIFHSGTSLDGGKVIATGGRVLGVTAIASDLSLAQKRVYEAIDNIVWPEGFYRKDIGWRELKRG